MRRALRLLQPIAALATLAVVPTAATAADPRPNLLFLIADDWSYPHAGAYGDRAIRTPNFDRVAAEGVLFTNAYCASPSCTPSRGAILTGQAIHRLDEGGNLWSRLPSRFAVYPDLLEEAGYRVGFAGKGWGPGTIEGSGRDRNPAGPRFPDFDAFLREVPDDRPFCFWYGSFDPHRPYDEGSGEAAGMDPAKVDVPRFLPDDPVVRSDILDYGAEVRRFDRQVGAILERLESSGRAENTIVVVTSDNGMPFPRCKANLYDFGTRMPLAIRWPSKVAKGGRVDAFVSHTDLAPTFLEAAGVAVPGAMTGRSILALLLGEPAEGRDRVYLGRERHANVRRGDLSYPCRGVRTAKFLYIRNLRPDRWPAGDPEMYVAVGPYGDVDDGPTKQLILGDPEKFRAEFRLAFAKRPAEELYDLEHDPFQLKNVIGHPSYADAERDLRADLDRWMRETGDPRALDEADDRWDRFEYVGPSAKEEGR